jgi:hypothetical protein
MTSVTLRNNSLKLIVLLQEVTVLLRQRDPYVLLEQVRHILGTNPNPQ